MADYLYDNAVFNTYNFGSTAPSTLPTFPELQPEPSEQTEVVQPSKEPELVRSGILAEPRSKVQISLFVLLFAPVLLACAVMLLFSYMRLNTLSFESAAMVSQIQTLEEKQTRLQIDYESTFDLAEVETYAKTVLGMVKAGADQTTLVRSSEGDRAQVLAEQSFFADWERKLDALVRKLQAYFR